MVKKTFSSTFKNSNLFKFLSCLAEQLCASKLSFILVKIWRVSKLLVTPLICLLTAEFGFFPSYFLRRLYLSPKTVVHVVYSRNNEKLERHIIFIIWTLLFTLYHCHLILQIEANPLLSTALFCKKIQVESTHSLFWWILSCSTLSVFVLRCINPLWQLRQMIQNQKALLGLLINVQGCGQMFETIK